MLTNFKKLVSVLRPLIRTSLSLYDFYEIRRWDIERLSDGENVFYRYISLASFDGANISAVKVSAVSKFLL
jgi:hypothetical protein